MARFSRRKSLKAPESLDGVIERAGEDRFAKTRAPIPDRAWALALGARIADRAKPIQLERGVLTVRAATSVWANELSLLSTTIIERLVAGGFAVRELRFRVGAIDPPPRPIERRPAKEVPPPAPLPSELANELTHVEDDELRDLISTAAKANLAWQRHMRNKG